MKERYSSLSKWLVHLLEKKRGTAGAGPLSSGSNLVTAECGHPCTL